MPELKFSSYAVILETIPPAAFNSIAGPSIQLSVPSGVAIVIGVGVSLAE